MTLPQPGPGRPHHPSYSAPTRGLSPLELVVLVLFVAYAGGLISLAEALL